MEMDTGDFADPLRRRLAEIYWRHQQEEGEPVFKEFLGLLSELGNSSEAPSEGEIAGETPPAGSDAGSALTELAVELVDEIDEDAELDVSLSLAMDYLAQERKSREQNKLLARLRRKSEGTKTSAGPDEAHDNPDDPQPRSGGETDGEANAPPADHAAQQELALFAALVKNNQPTNLHRLGPVRRGGS